MLAAAAACSRILQCWCVANGPELHELAAMAHGQSWLLLVVNGLGVCEPGALLTCLDLS
jgi:hypothetical protein